MKWLKGMPSRVDRVIVLVLVITGLLLPWAVAIGVKLYLQAVGTPTVSWSNIASYAIFFGPIGSVIAAAPLIVLAILYREWTVGALGRLWLSRATPLQGRLVVLSAFAGCVAGMVRVFIGVFWDFDALVLWFIPGVVAMYLPWMGGGLVVGALVAAIAGFVVRHGAGASTASTPSRAAGGTSDAEPVRDGGLASGARPARLAGFPPSRAEGVGGYRASSKSSMGPGRGPRNDEQVR